MLEVKLTGLADRLDGRTRRKMGEKRVTPVIRVRNNQILGRVPRTHWRFTDSEHRGN